MTLPQLRALTAFWMGSPPVQVSVARYLGIKPAVPRPTALPSREEVIGALGLPGGHRFVPPVRMLEPAGVQTPGQETTP